MSDRGSAAQNEGMETALDHSAPSAGSIQLRGVRVNNLKNIDLDIPHGQMVALCGLRQREGNVAGTQYYTRGPPDPNLALEATDPLLIVRPLNFALRKHLSRFE